MNEPQNLDLSFTGLGRTPSTHTLFGAGDDSAITYFVNGLSRTERCVLGVLCDQIATEIQRQNKERA